MLEITYYSKKLDYTFYQNSTVFLKVNLPPKGGFIKVI